jgi:polyribonucleotide nucleotidyltransferase
VSELSDKYVDRVDDVVQMGQEIKVKVLLIDDQGRIKLSRKAAMQELGESDPDPVGAPAGAEGEEGEMGGDRPPRREGGGGYGGGGDRGPRREGGGGGRGGDRGRRGGGGGGGGRGGDRGPRRD